MLLLLWVFLVWFVCLLFEIGYSVDQASLKRLFFMLPLPKGWGYTPVPPGLDWGGVGINFDDQGVLISWFSNTQSPTGAV